MNLYLIKPLPSARVFGHAVHVYSWVLRPACTQSTNKHHDRPEPNVTVMSHVVQGALERRSVQDWQERIQVREIIVDELGKQIIRRITIKYFVLFFDDFPLRKRGIERDLDNK